MPYRDTWATCENCEDKFVYRIEDQRRQAEGGEQTPARMLCRNCSGEAPRRSEPAPRTEPRRSEPAPRTEPRRSEPTTTVPKAPAAIGAGPHEGTVKWFSSQKGYGFIVHASGDEVFFHSSGVMPGETLDFPDGEAVTYLIEETEKGPQAVDVAKMHAPEPSDEYD